MITTLLLAQETISLSVGTAIAAVSALVGGGIVWGAMRQTLRDLAALVARVETAGIALTAEVVKLRAEVVELKTEVSIMKAVSKAVDEVTAKHESTNPGAGHAAPRRIS